jgi:hypothetical protein
MTETTPAFTCLSTSFAVLGPSICIRFTFARLGANLAAK